MRALKQEYWALCVMLMDFGSKEQLLPLSLFIGDIETGCKQGKISGCHKANDGHKGHMGHVLCLAVTSDNKYLVRTVLFEGSIKPVGSHWSCGSHL